MDMQHLRIGSKLHQFTVQIPRGVGPGDLITGTATNVTVTNVTDAYHEVEFDFVPSNEYDPTMPGVVQVRPWSAPFFVDED
jgi:hypothetical protein